MLLVTIFLTVSLYCSVLLADFSSNSEEHMNPERLWQRTLHLTKRHSWLTPKHRITDCISMLSEEGQYMVGASDFNGEVCGVYVFSDPKQIIEISLETDNVPCETNGLVAFVDGWELNGQLFPSPVDHLLKSEERFEEFCGNPNGKYVLRSSQNVALVQFRLPASRTGFTLSIRFLQNPTPCNILLQDTEAILTLRNFGRKGNCSVSALFPTVIKILAANIGKSNGHAVRPSTLDYLTSKCDNQQTDLLQIGCSDQLDNSNLHLVAEICGDRGNIGRYGLYSCGISTVRLISSGHYNNAVTILMKQISEDTLLT